MEDYQKQYEKLLKKRNGRPKGSANHGPIVRRFAVTSFPITVGGVQQQLRPFEIVLLTLRAMTAEGIVRAAEYLEQLEERYSSAPRETGASGHAVLPEPVDDETWIREQEEKNKHRKPPPMHTSLDSD